MQFKIHDRKGLQTTSSNCELMTNASLKSNDPSDTKDTVVMDQNDQSIFSPPPGSQVSDEFGGLKKSEAIDLFFKKLNSMFKSIKGYYQYDIDVVCRIDELGNQLCDLMKADPNYMKDNESLGLQMQKQLTYKKQLIEQKDGEITDLKEKLQNFRVKLSE